MEYSIRIVDDHGNPCDGVKVTVHYPWTWSEEFTDDDGWARFEKSGGGESIKVFVRGEKVSETYAEDGDTFSFTLP